MNWNQITLKALDDNRVEVSILITLEIGERTIEDASFTRVLILGDSEQAVLNTLVNRLIINVPG